MPNKKNLLIYAHYYIPDTASTGQILRELAEGMGNPLCGHCMTVGHLPGTAAIIVWLDVKGGLQVAVIANNFMRIPKVCLSTIRRLIIKRKGICLPLCPTYNL